MVSLYLPTHDMLVTLVGARVGESVGVGITVMLVVMLVVLVLSVPDDDGGDVAVVDGGVVGIAVGGDGGVDGGAVGEGTGVGGGDTHCPV
jgi:hypothetical protein